MLLLYRITLFFALLSMKKQEKLTLYISPELARLLRDESIAQNRSVSGQIAFIVNQFFNAKLS